MKDSTEQTHEYRMGTEWIPCTSQEAKTAKMGGREVRPLPPRELTKLEQDIHRILVDPKLIELEEGQTIQVWYTKAIAELFRKKIELAFDAGRDYQGNLTFGTKFDQYPNKDQWIKDNL